MGSLKRCKCKCGDIRYIQATKKILVYATDRSSFIVGMVVTAFIRRAVDRVGMAGQTFFHCGGWWSQPSSGGPWTWWEWLGRPSFIVGDGGHSLHQAGRGQGGNG